MKEKTLFPLYLRDRSLLTQPGSSRTTWHIVLSFDSSFPLFHPGDSVAIYPENSALIVEKILSILNANKESTVREKRGEREMNLYDYLLKRANIHQVPPSLFRLAAERGDFAALSPLLQPEAKEELHNHLASFELWDFLVHYRSVHFTPQEIVNSLLPLLPRFYSIASSPVVYSDEIHLTVGHVNYETRGEMRYGVGSHFLCYEAPLGYKIASYVQYSTHFHLPEDHTKPLIMIGPGTGIAPFKAFLEEREAVGATGKNWLFFGERNRNTDFYYESLFSSLEKKDLIKLSLAFSRDKKDKVYVQHLMEQQGEEIYNWIKSGALIYVCGDAKKMAKDVDLTLQQIIKQHQGLSEEESRLFLKQLKAEKRYLMDVY